MTEDTNSFADDEGESTIRSPRGIVYLNNAHQARLSPSVKKIGVSYVMKEPWEMSYADVLNDQHQVRSLFGQLIGGMQAKDIAIMGSTAFAVTLAAHNIYQQMGGQSCEPGRILVLQDQFDSAIYPWQEICRLSKGNLKLDVVSYPQGDETWTRLVLAKLRESMRKRTSDQDYCDCIQAVCLPPLHWSDGSTLDLQAVGELCGQAQPPIPFVVDATQAVGVFPIDCASYKCCMLACSTHKWLRGPSGASLVYINESLHEKWSPLDQHSRGRELPVTEEAKFPSMGPDGYPETFYKDARKFDCGGKANPHLIPMLCASLQEVAKLDLVKVQEQLAALVQPLLTWAASHDFIVPPRNSASHLVGIRPKRKTAPKELMRMALRLQQEWCIYVAPRCGGFRISPYVDNTQQDIDRLIEGLESIMTENNGSF